jgi:hypothetical protein
LRGLLISQSNMIAELRAALQKVSQLFVILEIMLQSNEQALSVLRALL